MKKAQIEMVGLTIIVVLIIVIGLFALRIILREKPLQNEEFYSVKSNNLINTLKQVSVCERDFEQAMIACCENNVYCNQNACEFVNEFVTSIMNKTVEQDYYFELKNNDQICTFVGSCTTGISSSTIFLRSETGVYNSKVILCTK